MPIPWEPPIRQSRQLTIFTAASAQSTTWSTVLDNALVEFNRMSATERLGVTFSKTTQAPSDSGSGGANVSFNTLAGATTFRAFGQDFRITVDGNGLIGHTQRIMSELNGVRVNSKAFIFVPATPRAEGANGRVIGDPAKLVMVFHELIHACGLDNSDHSNNDVFFGFPSFSMDRDPNKDRIEAGNTRMPPIVMTAETVRKVRSVW